MILFLNYPLKIGDSISILKENRPLTIRGEIKDIGAFFITFRTLVK